MDQSKNSENSVQTNMFEVFVVLFFVFAVFAFFLFRYLNGESTQVKKETSSADTILDSRLRENDKGSENDNLPSIDIEKNTANVYEKYSEKSLEVPEQKANILKIGEYDTKKYNKDFEQIYKAKVKEGMTSENDIFIAQLKDKNTFLKLSEFDKDTLTINISIYENFAKEVEKLETPTKYKVKGEESVKAARAIKYILEKIKNEESVDVYKLWILKYAQEINAILAARYVQN